MLQVGTNKLWLSLPNPCHPHPLHLCDLSLALEMTTGNSTLQQCLEQSGKGLPGCQHDIRFPELLLFIVAYSEKKTKTASGQKEGTRLALSEFTVWGFVRSESKDEKR